MSGAQALGRALLVPRYWVGWLLYPGLALSARRAAGATAGPAATRGYLGRPLASLTCTGRHLFGLPSYKCAPKSALPGAYRLDSLQADVYRVRISPGFACPSCLVQSRCLRSVTVGGRRLRFVLLVAVGPEVLRVITHSDRGLGWNLVSLRTRGITR